MEIVHKNFTCPGYLYGVIIIKNKLSLIIILQAIIRYEGRILLCFNPMT